jgi:uncharacterized protein YbgA (DUF1722 family)/uncharacterized protein YbbK (DUF523 family)
MTPVTGPGEAYPRPRVVISRCIDFDACRYNGQVISTSLRGELEPHVDFLPICPELEIGLGVPRDPVRLVRRNGEARMVQPSTGRDLTRAMGAFSKRFLSGVGEVDGFILKSRSPSCGPRNAKVYQGEDGPPAPGSGLFAARVEESFPGAAISDEGRLNNLVLRDHFLTRLFTLTAFREMSERRSPGALVDFQARNKLLLMGYNQARMRAMGRIAGEQRSAPIASVLARYREELEPALSRPPRIGPNVNVLMHALGHFSSELSAREKAHFLDLLEAYRERRAPLSAVTSLLRSWAVRFEVPYISEQTYFAPFPEALVRFEPLRRRGRDPVERD